MAVVLHSLRVVPDGSDETATTRDRGRIIIAEDNAAIREILTTILTRRGGFDVTAAEDGQAALEQLQAFEEQTPDGRRRLRVELLVLDIMMPRMTGLELLRAVHDAYDPLPRAMIVSALDDEPHIAEALALGALDYMPKPIDMAVFLQRVRALVAAEREAPCRWAPLAGRPLVMLGHRTAQARAISEAGIIVQCPAREGPAMEDVVPLASPVFADVGVSGQLRGRVVRTTPVGTAVVVELWFVGLREREAHGIRRYAISR